MDCPLISVIVPVYNAEAYLDQCVGSLVGQTYRNLEIILVDDGSPDNSPRICDAWAAKDSRIRVVHKENQGPSAARNTGIHASEGDWIVFVDADDVPSVHLIQRLVSHQPDRYTLCVSNYTRFTGEQPNEPLPQQPCFASPQDLGTLRSGHYCWAILYNRKTILDNGIQFPVSLSNLEDVVWNTHYLLYTKKLLFIPEPLYNYRYTASSITSRCPDHRWQAAAWNNARNAIVQSVHGLSLTKPQKKQIAKAFRLCQNNLFAECHIGKLTFSDYRDVFSASGLLPVFSVKLEQALMAGMPRFYFAGYSLLMKLRYALSSWRSSRAK